MPGAKGWFTEVGSTDPLPRKQLLRLRPDSHVSLGFPGGAGWGDPHHRDPGEVFADVIAEKVSPESAREHYGVVVEWTGDPSARVRHPDQWRLDEEATARVRAASRATPGD